MSGKIITKVRQRQEAAWRRQLDAARAKIARSPGQSNLAHLFNAFSTVWWDEVSGSIKVRAVEPEQLWNW